MDLVTVYLMGIVSGVALGLGAIVAGVLSAMWSEKRARRRATE